MSRSMSPMPLRASRSSCRAMSLSTSDATASRRRSMATGFSSGCCSHERRLRAPIGVLVLSSTHSRLPRFSLVRSVSVSSRLRRAVTSSSMYAPVR